MTMGAESELRQLRAAKGWSQARAAARLGVSQTYWSLLESGSRAVTPALAERLVRLGVAPNRLALPSDLDDLGEPVPDELVGQLAALGYPGFSHFRPARRPQNPAAVALWALRSERLEARIFEGLPWLMVRHWPLDVDWVVRQAKLHDLQNRAGFVVTLARQLAERDGAPTSTAEGLRTLERALEPSRLAREEALGDPGLGEGLRARVRQERSPAASHWNLLTDWKLEHLRRVEQEGE
jgi:transcriptional regulator with XRE-family HTH domain